MKKLIIALFVLALGAGLSTTSYAGTEATTLDVSANLLAACTVSATGIAFADYDGTSFVYASGGDVTVNCSSGILYNIALDAGLSYEALISGERHVSDGVGGYITYQLYKEGAYLNEWGDSDFAYTYPAGASLADTGDGTGQTHTVYGVLASTSSPPGPYGDTVNVTVYY